MPKTSEIQIDPETALAMLRTEREEDEQVNATFYLVGHRPGEGPVLVIVPCVEPPSITALLIPAMAAREDMIVDSVAMAMDTYRFLDFQRPDDDVDLKTLFEAGDPRVSEALVVACVDKDGPGWYVSQTYIALDGDVVWGEVENIDMGVTVGGLDEGAQDHWQSLRRQLEGLLR